MKTIKILPAQVNRSTMMDYLDKFAYSEEPLADEDWVAEYNKQLKKAEELEEQLVKRLDGTTPTSVWAFSLDTNPSKS